jgi:hypothetical protein
MSLRSRLSRLFGRASGAGAKLAPKRPAARPKRAAPRPRRTGSGQGPNPLAAIVVEVGKLVREMVVIPVSLWLRIAEPAGEATLWAWRHVVRPALAWVAALVASIYRFALRHVTPARAVALVALVSIGVLIASQWVDYRGIRIGNDAYAGDAGLVAPAPEVGKEQAGEAHAWVMVPLALAALVVLALAVTGRRLLARLLIPIGVAVIAITLLVDLPNGLDEGAAAVAYEDTSAHLLEGFWLQIAAAAGLIVSGLLLPGFLRPEAARAPARRRAGARARRRRTLGVGEART